MSCLRLYCREHEEREERESYSHSSNSSSLFLAPLALLLSQLILSAVVLQRASPSLWLVLLSDAPHPPPHPPHTPPHPPRTPPHPPRTPPHPPRTPPQAPHPPPSQCCPPRSLWLYCGDLPPLLCSLCYPPMLLVPLL